MRFEVKTFKAPRSTTIRYRVFDTKHRRVAYTGFRTRETADACANSLNSEDVKTAPIPTLVAESVQTPTRAKEFATIIAAACFNDEIRAIVARELLSRILTPADDAIAAKHTAAFCAAGELTTAYDRQYRD